MPDKDLIEQDLNQALDRAVRAYIADRRAAIPGFVAANFHLPGALKLNALGLGWDLMKGPINVFLAVPFILAQLGGAALKRAGAVRVGQWLGARRIFLPTRVAAEVEWRLCVDWLGLPLEQDGRVSSTDALADYLTHAAGDLSLSADQKAAFLADAVHQYKSARVAASELTNAAVSTGIGAALFSKLTPGALSMGPAIAGLAAYEWAVAEFPLGDGLGSLWYSAFPPETPWGLTVASTGLVVSLIAILSAFSGMIADPVQAATGLHARRLNKFLDSLEIALLDRSEARLRLRDHYLARLIDVVDAVRMAT